MAAALGNTANLMDSTAAALEDITGSMGNMGAALTDAADLLDRLATTTSTLADSLNVSILGQRPFAGASENLESIASDLDTFAGHSATLAERPRDARTLPGRPRRRPADGAGIGRATWRSGSRSSAASNAWWDSFASTSLLSALLAAWLAVLAGGLHLGRSPAPAGRGHPERRDHPHQLSAAPPTTATAPITTQVRLPVMKLDDTITLRPCRIHTVPASATSDAQDHGYRRDAHPDGMLNDGPDLLVRRPEPFPPLHHGCFAGSRGSGKTRGRPPSEQQPAMSISHSGGSRVTYSDQVLACVDCGTEFVFSASEQSFFAEKGFTSPPKRCPSCRAQRRASGGYGGSSSSSYGSGGGYGGGYDRGPREMHDAVCARCGKETQVPFKPTGTRPVYCSDCFRLVRG